jgi:hypothetical protein
MSASIGIHWPECTQEEEYGHPGFYNDDGPWANWLCEAVSDSSVSAAVIDLGCKALLSHTTNGMSDEEVDWVTPDELTQAALQMSKAIAAKHPLTRTILAAYEKQAIGEEAPEIEIDRDLHDVIKVADYAKDRGAKRVTLSVNW